MLVNPPIGTPGERATGKVWPGSWFDATGFGRNTVAGYTDGYHTGADLNLNSPSWDLDKGAPVYAAADGIVVCSDNFRKSWGWIIVIEHTDDTGNKFYTRYAHLNHTNFLVVPVNTSVTLGATIGAIGNADGYYGSADHLHFDVSLTDILKTAPDNWPGTVKTAEVLARLEHNYVDPKAFILANRTQKPQADAGVEAMRVDTDVLVIRAQPDISIAPIGTLATGDEVDVTGSFPGDGYIFAKLLSINGMSQDEPAYVARQFLEPA